MPHLFTKDDAGDHVVDRSLRIRTIIFFIISLVLIGFIVRDTLLGDLTVWLAVLSLGIGILVGFILGSAARITRRNTDDKIVSQSDTLGFIAIAAFIVFDLSRTWIAGHFFAGTTLSAFSLALLAGALFGRFIGLRRSIQKVLSI